MSVRSFQLLIGTAVLIFREPPNIDGHARFLTVTFKSCCDQYCGEYCFFFYLEKYLNFDNFPFLESRYVRVTFVEKPQIKIINSQNQKHEAEYKEFEPRFKFKPRLDYSWFHLKLYEMFQDLSRRSI